MGGSLSRGGIIMNKGDTITLNLDFSLNGTPLGNVAIQEMELYIADQCYTLGQIKKNPNNKYYLILDANHTHILPSVVRYQLRVKYNNQWISSEISRFSLGGTLWVK